MKRTAFTGKHKIQDRWDSMVYRVIQVWDNVPILKVSPMEGSTDSSKVVHRNLLLPLNTDPAQLEVDDPIKDINIVSKSVQCIAQGSRNVLQLAFTLLKSYLYH